jgi:pyruvate/2-oxoglutarate dehydrogenase complex dihydrolipoamide dehydrogenase (E3) component
MVVVTEDSKFPCGVFDLVVVGGGAAGMTSALLAASKGSRVALIEEAALGGECFNTGCIPSKSIIRTSRLYSDMMNAENFGGKVPPNIKIDFGDVMARMRRIKTQISSHLSFAHLQKMGVEVYWGRARFSGPRSVMVAGQSFEFKKCILAVGAKPMIPDIPGLAEAGYLTSENVFNLETLPESLLVLGGGAIGCELAQAFCRLGSRVYIVQDAPMFLDNVERDGAQILSDALALDGIEIHLNSTVLQIRKLGDKKVIDIIDDGNKCTVSVTDILVGVGQIATTQDLDLDAADIRSGERGAIEADKYFRSSNPDIFVVGSASSKEGLSHIPVAAARCATLNALFGERQTISEEANAWCIYTDPEISHIGLQVIDARKRGIPVKTFTVLMHQVDRAIADSEDKGFVKIHVREGTDQILGGTIVSRHAGDIVNAISLAMSAGIGLCDFAKIHLPYPTQGDAIKMAAMQYDINRSQQ